MDTIYIYIILIVVVIGFLYYKKYEYYKNHEKYEIIENKKPITKYDKISYMLFPNCNFLEGDQGETCKKTKGCFYNNGCYFNWQNIQ